MKKLFLGLAIVVSSLTFAQQFGIKAGVNLSTVSDAESLTEVANSVDAKSKVGFNAGVFANFPVAESFSVQPELLYNALGTKLTNKGNTGNDNALTLNLDYLSLPVMFQYNLVPNLYLEAGPQFSYLLSSKFKYNGNSTDSNTDGLNKFDIGIGLGAGYYFNGNIGITARYVAGLTDIIKDNPTDTSFKNNAFQVGLAFKFK